MGAKIYIYIFSPFSLFVSVYVYASVCDFCLYSFALTIYPRVLSVHCFLCFLFFLLLKNFFFLIIIFYFYFNNF